MINEIMEAVSAALLDAFGCECYLEDLPQAAQRPCFVINCLGASCTRNSLRRFSRENHFRIRYLPSAEGGCRECVSVAEAMFLRLEAVGPEGGLMRGTGMRWEIADGIVNFYADYNGFLQTEDPAPEMEAAEVRQRIKPEV